MGCLLTILSEHNTHDLVCAPLRHLPQSSLVSNGADFIGVLQKHMFRYVPIIYKSLELMMIYMLSTVVHSSISTIPVPPIYPPVSPLSTASAWWKFNCSWNSGDLQEDPRLKHQALEVESWKVENKKPNVLSLTSEVAGFILWWKQVKPLNFAFDATNHAWPQGQLSLDRTQDRKKPKNRSCGSAPATSFNQQKNGPKRRALRVTPMPSWKTNLETKCPREIIKRY